MSTFAFFSGWSLFGFVLGAIAGTLATDLTREEFRIESFGRPWRFWDSRQQFLTFVFGLWIITLLVATVIFNTWTELIGGSIIGAAAAPWLWLHFIRNFGGNEKREAERKREQIEKRAYEISQQKPDGTEQENWYQAKREIEEVEQLLAETSDKSADQQLTRYQLLSVVLGTALLVAILLPALKTWLLRAQQFSAFGISLTLLERQASNQNRGTPVIGSPSSEETGGDRLLDATTAAYQIGAADLRAPRTSLRRIGATLNDFRYLSVIDVDRSFIAWLIFEQPGMADELRQIETSANLTLIKYVEKAEDLLRNSRDPEGWADPELDRAFVADTIPISKCLRAKAQEIHDPHFFAVEFGQFLNRVVRNVYAGNIEDLVYYSRAAKIPNERVGCEFDFPELLNSSVHAPLSVDEEFEVSPYPSLVAADYLAAIGAVDTGVQTIEHWIKEFKRIHKASTRTTGLSLNGIY